VGGVAAGGVVAFVNTGGLLRGGQLGCPSSGSEACWIRHLQEVGNPTVVLAAGAKSECLSYNWMRCTSVIVDRRELLRRCGVKVFASYLVHMALENYRAERGID
jgi:hypothetical protein